MRSIETMEGNTRIKGFHDEYGQPMRYEANLHLLVIRLAYDKGCSTLQVEDWSILRDADPDRMRLNLERALAFLRSLS